MSAPDSAKRKDRNPTRLWRHLGLRERLLLTLVTVALIPVLALSWVEHRQIRSDTLVLAESTLGLIADAQQRRLNLEWRRLHDLVELVASRTQMRLSLDAYNRDGDPAHLKLIERILDDALQSIRGPRGLWIRDPSGRTLTGVARDGVPANAIEPPVNPSLGLETPRFRHLDRPDPELWLAGPLRLNEATIGSLHLLVGMEDIQALLADFPHPYPGGESVLLLCDADAGLLALNAREGIWNPATARSTPLNDWLRSSTPAVGGCLEGAALPIPRDEILLHAERTLALDRARLLVYTSLDKMGQIARPRLDPLLYVTLSLVLLVLMMAVTMARAITAPIQALSEATRRLREGDYQVRIPEQGWGELAALTHDFNEAAAALQREILARRASERELANLANTDALTGLNNRRRFLELLRHGSDREHHPATDGALLYLDLDGFKPINDRYGHDAGDAVLRIVAERLRRLIRENDSLGRLGGDEFAILLNGIEPGFEPEALVQRIHESIARPMLVQGRELRVGCSLGVARIHAKTDPIGLLKEADAAMYRAKALKAEASRQTLAPQARNAPRDTRPDLRIIGTP
ncbi:sensor domain-containing diguanylate cyclase [Thiocystis violacea]|uniref:sensor domain-containing diguanylate cyclase n=1 Tax=Thiocystis violacea TaxID=13725 RepID=UPI0019048DE8|nr:sensor domain-containing diguanylate cyclase [Thiocystis violacea]MBK1717571.1 hypothetical protein [Thiocystis violacea]